MKYIEKENKVVVKLYEDDTFLQSVIIPTSKYPLSSNDFKVFSCENTEIITDKNILNIIDSVKFELGHCYLMADKLVSALRDYHAEMYSGWRFSGDVLPVHHSWCIIEDKYLIDLSDMDDDLMQYIKTHVGTFDKNMQLPKEFYIEYMKKATELKNTERITHIGRVSERAFYVGSKDNMENAKQIYRNLITKYPDHEIIRNKNGMGTPLQLEIMDKRKL